MLVLYTLDCCGRRRGAAKDGYRHLVVYTNAPGYARTLLEIPDGFSPGATPDAELQPLIGALFGDPVPVHSALPTEASWRHVLISDFAPRSNVETTAAVAPTAFVPAVTSVRDLVSDPSAARELRLEGRAEPVTGGRLILDAPGHTSHLRAS